VEEALFPFFCGAEKTLLACLCRPAILSALLLEHP
jgi:hypothetical protein